MSKKRRRVRIKKNLVVVLGVVFILASAAGSPALAADIAANGTQVQVTENAKHKEEISKVRKKYKGQLKLADQNYRNAVESAKKDYQNSLKNAKTKGDRLDARKKYRKAIREAREKMLKDKRSEQREFRSEISSIK